MSTDFQDRTSLIQKTFEKNPAVVYTLDPELRIAWCNETWDRFAAENGGIGLERQEQAGQPIMDVIPAPLKQFFQDNYGNVLLSGEPWEHSYECSSPTVYRAFRMLVYLNPEADGLIVVNSLTVERPHPAADGPGEGEELFYPDEHGMVTMCCQCRRTCRANRPDTWDWVPAFVARPPELLTHGICDVCANLIYPEFAAQEGA